MPNGSLSLVGFHNFLLYSYLYLKSVAVYQILMLQFMPEQPKLLQRYAAKALEISWREKRR